MKRTVNAVVYSTILSFISVTPAISEGRYGTILDLARQFNKSSPWESAGGSRQLERIQPSGNKHITSTNSGAGVHLSQDVTPSGQIINRHWTDHATGKKIGDRD